MQNWALDNHPILTKFRTISKTITIDSKNCYYLFLTPPYANPNESDLNPLMYFYYSTPAEPTILHQYDSRQNLTFELEGNTIRSHSGFNTQFSINLLLSQPCTSSSLEGHIDFTYMLEEMDDDIYHHFEVPHLMKKIEDCYRDYKLSKQFLYDLYDQTLTQKLNEIERCFFTAEINETNFSQFVNLQSTYIIDVAQIVFTLPATHILPSAVKRHLNFLIFNAITSAKHYQLLATYNSAYSKENVMAQENTRNSTEDFPVQKLKKEELEEAVKNLRNVLNLPSPADMVECIVKFFDLVVAALPGVEVSADDILPAICVAMTRSPNFGSHVVSFFTYLADLWPTTGVDEKITYIIITCSIAASHLSTKIRKSESETKIPQTPPPQPQEQLGQSTQETIQLLQDLLDLV